jgi:hypothetical protein
MSADVMISRERLAELKRNSACPCCTAGMAPTGKPCAECVGTGLVALAYDLCRTRLKVAQEAVRWRPIAEIHEDLGPCVLIRINDPGYMAIGNNLDLDFDVHGWTHFVPVPSLTNADAAGLVAAMR